MSDAPPQFDDLLEDGFFAGIDLDEYVRKVMKYRNLLSFTIAYLAL